MNLKQCRDYRWRSTSDSSANYRTNTFAQPGLAAGAEYTSFTCASVRPAALADDLIDSPGANNKCPKEGHLVALVIAPGFDFHWYRKGRNGYWTHKFGGTPATNVDNSNNLIPDPRAANRGPYTDFCTFMIVMHGHIKIRMAGALIYSGHPDPNWIISRRAVEKLRKIWESLPPADEKWEPRSGRLGYRGSFLKGADNSEWVAFKGLVSLTTLAGMEVRRDVAMEFEKASISWAPKGLLPENLSEGAWTRP